jgi:hypothetical protein
MCVLYCIVLYCIVLYYNHTVAYFTSLHCKGSVEHKRILIPVLIVITVQYEIALMHVVIVPLKFHNTGKEIFYKFV